MQALEPKKHYAVMRKHYSMEAIDKGLLHVTRERMMEFISAMCSPEAEKAALAVIERYRSYPGAPCRTGGRPGAQE